MIQTYGILTLLEAKPGKGDDLNAFLKTCHAVVAGEAETISWYAFKLSDTTYGIFGTFITEDGRQAYMNGKVPAELGKIADVVLTKEPDIRQVNIVAVK
ncbi:putative quinol monooxygenase [Candidatus Mycobacterium methanotrophicum]|uniref:Antibiotic biosynthesis monooxygenase n=1 Tax=Candidatus Mycobacterium methanotrophicum TaxID=2943498 RepID=A0ABY4QMW6_9MYCO|nr:antibiotic biosynthesis monooxygenase [Candidatus Mycobacterium methanotrophicum]UQX11133.1 antibiotic biosynthesis monooxygenase [Candidatus Mycobacterium methanotrophicum]